jgi:hypothetical protein
VAEEAPMSLLNHISGMPSAAEAEGSLRPLRQSGKSVGIVSPRT